MKYYIDSRYEVWISIYEWRADRNRSNWMYSLSRLVRAAAANLFADFMTALLFILINWRIANGKDVIFLGPLIFFAIIIQARLTNDVWQKNDKSKLVLHKYSIGFLEKCCILSKIFLCIIVFGFVLSVFFYYR